MEIVNWKIVAHPMNWVTLFLMVFIFGIVAHLLLANLPTVAINNMKQTA
jgi:hypothetical protein